MTPRRAAPSRGPAPDACTRPPPDRRQPGPETTPDARSGTPAAPEHESRHEARSACRTAAEKPKAGDARSADGPAQPEFDQGSDRRQPGCETRTGTPPVTPARIGQRDAPEGLGRSPREAQSIESKPESDDGMAQAAEPPDDPMLSLHCVPGRIAHAVGPPRPSASRRGRASGRAGDAGTTTWRAPRRRPDRGSIRPSQPTSQSRDKYREQRVGGQQRPTSASEDARQRRVVKRERGCAPAPSREARARMRASAES
jgi:hypothetical protein